MFEITPEEQLRVNGYIVYNSCKALNFPERKENYRQRNGNGGM